MEKLELKLPFMDGRKKSAEVNELNNRVEESPAGPLIILIFIRRIRLGRDISIL